MSVRSVSNRHEQWLKQAEEDLAVAKLVMRHAHMAHACFFSQQCMEKSLKGFLLSRGESYRRTHRLIELLLQCRKANPAFLDFDVDCMVVDQYYIPTRYPDSVPRGAVDAVPGEAEAAEAVAAAETLFQFVQQQLAA